MMDEVDKGETLLRSLLRAANERRWRNGDVEMNLPLITMVASANEVLPDHLAPVWVRFLIRESVTYVVEASSVMAMLTGEGKARTPTRITVDELQTACNPAITAPCDIVGSLPRPVGGRRPLRGGIHADAAAVQGFTDALTSVLISGGRPGRGTSRSRRNASSPSPGRGTVPAPSACTLQPRHPQEATSFTVVASAAPLAGSGAPETLSDVVEGRSPRTKPLGSRRASPTAVSAVSRRATVDLSSPRMEASCRVLCGTGCSTS